MGPGAGIGRDSYGGFGMGITGMIVSGIGGMVILIREKKKKGLQGYVAPDREGT